MLKTSVWSVGLIWLVCLVISLISQLDIGLQTFVVADCQRDALIKPNDPVAEDKFGTAVSVEGDTAVIGAYKNVLGVPGSAYVFHEISPGNWEESQKLSASDGSADDAFGVSVDLHGATLLVGATYMAHAVQQTGAVYVFTENSLGVWGQVQKLVPSTGHAKDFFGESVAIYDTYAWIGAWADDTLGEQTGAAYVFSETSPGNWNEIAKTTGPAQAMIYGRTLDVHRITAAVACRNFNSGRGAVYVFRETTPGAWTEIKQLTNPFSLVDGDWLGSSVAIYDDVLVTGASNDREFGTYTGAVYMYTDRGNDNWSYAAKIKNADPLVNKKFGTFVAMQKNLILISGENGKAHIFSRDGLEVTEVQQLEPSSSLLTWATMSNNTVVVSIRSLEGSVNFFSSECNANPPCLNGGQCVPGGWVCANVTCDCTGVGFAGEICDESCFGGVVGEAYGDCNCTGLASAGPRCNETCNGGIVGESSPDCDCTGLQAIGTRCERTCNNGYNTPTGTICNCTGTGATGKYCGNDINDCASSPCINGGSCSDLGDVWLPAHANEFNCSCDGTGHHGHMCEIHDCSSSPCLNGGMCFLAADGPDVLMSCNCTGTGYEGDSCETETDECASNPCQAGSTCTDELAGYTCDCTGTGQTGLLCEYDIDDCASNPCEHNGTCDDRGAYEFRCTCDPSIGYEGTRCHKLIDDCVLNGDFCENEGVCINELEPGNFSCNCNDTKFFGDFCEISAAKVCKRYTNPCLNGGICSLGSDRDILCDCDQTGYYGKTCNIYGWDLECVSAPCMNEGICLENFGNGPTCNCTNTGYEGTYCTNLLFCTSSPCLNGGLCNEDTSSCNCTDEFYGTLCGNELQFVTYENLCVSAPCSNGGSCVQDNNNITGSGFLCECEGYYAGMLCSELDFGCTESTPLILVSISLIAGSAVAAWLILERFPTFRKNIKRINDENRKQGKALSGTISRGWSIWGLFGAQFDFFTDLSFVLWLQSCDFSDAPILQYLFLASVGCLVVPVLFNVLGVFFVIRNYQDESFKEYVAKYSSIAAVFYLFSFINPTAILFLDSKILGIAPFCAGFTRVFKEKLQMLGLVTNLTEDLPQIVIQVWVSIEMGQFSNEALISIATSCLLLFINILRRCLMILVRKKVRQVPVPVTLDLDDAEKDLEDTEKAASAASAKAAQTTKKKKKKSVGGKRKKSIKGKKKKQDVKEAWSREPSDEDEALDMPV